MDALDVRILRTMGFLPVGGEPRDPAKLRPGPIARELGVTKKTVAERIARMTEEGLLSGYEVYPNFRQLGLDATCFYIHFGDDDVTAAAMEKLQAVPGVAGIYAFLGGVLCLMSTYSSGSDLERQLRAFAEVAGGKEVEKFYDLPLPPVARPLSSLDWRIVQALRGDALRPLTEVAKQLKVSSKTVKRRFDRMAKEGSVFVVPNLDPSRASGYLFFGMMIHYDPDGGPATLNALRKVYDRNLVAAELVATPRFGNVGLYLFAKNLAQIQQLVKAGSAVKGVAKVEPLMFSGAWEKFDWIDGAIAERVKAST